MEGPEGTQAHRSSKEGQREGKEGFGPLHTSNSGRGPRCRSFRRWNHQHLHEHQHQKPSRNKKATPGGGCPAGVVFVSRGLLMLVFMQMLMIPTPKGSTSRSSTRIRHVEGPNARDRQDMGNWQFEEKLRPKRQISSNCQSPVVCLSVSMLSDPRMHPKVLVWGGHFWIERN